MSVRYNSMILAIFSQIGGFLTPLVLSSADNHPHILFIYIALLNAGILAIAKWKVWRPLIFLSFIFTILIFSGWFSSHYTEAQFAIGESYATIFFLMFSGVVMLHHFYQKTMAEKSDLILIVLNSSLYYLISYIMLNGAYHDLRGLFTLAVAVFHILLSLLMGLERENEEKNFSQFYLAIGLSLLVLFIPIQFDKNWITIAWAAEGIILLFFGLKMDAALLRFFANFIFILTVARLIAFDTVNSQYMEPWLNDRTLSYALCLFFFILATIFYNRFRDKITDQESGLYSAYLILCGTTFLAGVTSELWYFYSHHWITAFWTALFLVSLSLSLIVKNAYFRGFAFSILALTTIRLLIFETVLSSNAEAFWNVRLMLFLFSIFSVMLAYGFYRLLPENLSPNEAGIMLNIFPCYCFFLLMWLVTAEIMDFHEKHWLPICWSLIAISGAFFSYLLKNVGLKILVLLTYILCAVHLLFVDLSFKLDGNYLPLFNDRVLSFFIVIASASVFVALARFFMDKDESLAKEYKIIATTFFIIINCLLFLLMSFELLDYFNYKLLQMDAAQKTAKHSSISNLKNMSLSVGWAIYAIAILALGIIRKSALARQLGIIIFSLAIFKVFLFDTSNLKTFYKFVSFFSLGIILILTGYLYSRFKDHVTQFIKAG